MWNSSTSMSGSPFCRQAATSVPSLIGGQDFAVLDTGFGGFRENVGVGIIVFTRLRASRARTR
ncbi:MAG TPA: hypothetical protein VH591_19410 [Ktedonobacterales bacterium]|jgi:hypothetical protein